MKDISELLKQPDTSIAVVGATDDTSKYGNVIYRDLKRKGYEVFAINPGRSTVDGDQAYPSLSELPVEPVIVNFVVPPQKTLEILKECKSLALMNVWIQPGAEDPQVLSYLQENDFNYLALACIMVESRFESN